MKQTMAAANVVLLWILLITGVMLVSGNEQPCQSVLSTRVFPADVAELPVVLELTNNAAYQTELYLNLTGERELRFLCDVGTHTTPCNGSYNVSRDHSYMSFLHMTPINGTHITMTLTRGMRVEDMAYIQLIERMTLKEDLVNKTYCHHYITIRDTPGNASISIGVNSNTADTELKRDILTDIQKVAEHNNSIIATVSVIGMFPDRPTSLSVNYHPLNCESSTTQNKTSGLFDKQLICRADYVSLPGGHLVVALSVDGAVSDRRTASLQSTTDPDDRWADVHAPYIIVICIIVLILITVCVLYTIQLRKARSGPQQRSTECWFFFCNSEKKVWMYSCKKKKIKCLTKAPDWVDECTCFFIIGPIIVLCGACDKANRQKRYEYDLITGKEQEVEMKVGIRTITACQTERNTAYIIGGLEWDVDDQSKEATLSDRCIKNCYKWKSKRSIQKMKTIPEPLYWQVLVHDPWRNQIHCLGGIKDGVEVLGRHYCYGVIQDTWKQLDDIDIQKNHTKFRASKSGAVVYEDTIYVLTPTYQASYKLGTENSKLIIEEYARKAHKTFTSVVPFLANKGNQIMALAHCEAPVENVILNYNPRTRTFSNPMKLKLKSSMRNQCLVIDRLPTAADYEDKQNGRSTDEGRPLMDKHRSSSREAEIVL